MILMGATLAAYKTGAVAIGYGPEETMWLGHAEQLVADAIAVGHELEFAVALEYDARGAAPFAGILRRLMQIENDTGATFHVWNFSLDTGALELDSDERLAHICMGRNLLTEIAMREGASHLLFADSDTVIPPDAISKLLELDWPIVGGEVPSYYGPNEIGPWGEAPIVHTRPTPAATPYDFPVRAHWNTAGFLLVERKLFSRLRWRTDLEHGLTDDPCYGHDALEQGYMTLVRQDLHGVHEPLVPVEHRGLDLRVYR
jgi:hypothetical protein